MEPISTALTHVQGDQANKQAQAVFKMVGVICCFFVPRNLLQILHVHIYIHVLTDSTIRRILLDCKILKF